MSFQKMDRNFQSKKGKSFHAENGQGGQPFAVLIAMAMLEEWGASPSARKEVARLTSANDRTVRNWFDGLNGPSGENLVALLRHSDAVFEMVLELSGRRASLTGDPILRLREQLDALVHAIDELRVH